MSTPSPRWRFGWIRQDRLDVSPRPMVVGRIVTATITLICVLIVYDGWSSLKLVDAIAIVVAPIIAIFTSHVFAGTLVQHVDLGRPPTWREWLGMVRFETRFLLLAIPPVTLFVILEISPLSLTQAIHVVVWLEALSLTFWAGLAAHYAGLRGRSMALALLGGLIMSSVVLLLQVVLQPGKAETGALGTQRHLPASAGEPTPLSNNR